MQLHDRSAIVTGGGSGLGAATARALAAAGVRVALFDVDLDGARELANEIGGAAFACDVADPDSTEAAFEAAAALHGPARIVMNVAGIGAAKRILNDRVRPVRHTADEVAAQGGAAVTRSLHAVPAAARSPAGVCATGAAHRHQQRAERRGHPPRRCTAHGAALKLQA